MNNGVIIFSSLELKEKMLCYMLLKELKECYVLFLFIERYTRLFHESSHDRIMHNAHVKNELRDAHPEVG